MIGSWIVNGWSCGIGVREDEKPDHRQPQPLPAARLSLIGESPPLAPKFPAGDCAGADFFDNGRLSSFSRRPPVALPGFLKPATSQMPRQDRWN